MPDPTSFADLGLRAELLQALARLGYEEPTPIQQEAIPPVLAGRDLLGQAATGTGKTAAFALPVLHRLAEAGLGGPPRALVLVPTRELAMQVAEAMHRYGRDLGVRVLPVYGGQPIFRQLRALDRGVDVVVATPGRALDHIRRGSLALGELQLAVLDEADEMLDMGFAEDIETILAESPAERQTLLFSATLPARIQSIAKKHLKNPQEIRIQRAAPEPGEVPQVRQVAYIIPRAHKLAALGRILDHEAPTAALVFCRTRTEVDEIHEALNGRGYRADALHGGMSQEQRDRVMKRLRSGQSDLLVATDVAARGLDVEQLTHVVHYEVPSSPESYVHRTGRVGRAGREGMAILLAEPREHRQLKLIERVTRRKIEVARLPTVADLRARRLELTRASIREALVAGELDRFGVVVEALADEFDVFEVAAAAIKLVHEAAGGDVEETDIPEVSPPREAPPRAKGKPARERPGARDRGPAWQGGPGGPRGGRDRAGGDRAEPMARIAINAGRNAGIRPQDLVGAIANEAGVSGRAIDILEIADRYSVVEVPAEVGDDVMQALRRTRIKGKKVQVRREG